MFKKIIIETAKGVLGPKKHEHQDWLDENDKCISQLLHEKNQAYVEWQNDPNSISKADKFRHLREQAKKRLCAMKYHLWDRKADEVQKYTSSNNSKQFFGALKTVYGPSQSGPTPFIYQLTDQHWTRTKRLWAEWWAEHFRNLLNRPSTVSTTALDRIPLHPTQDELDHQSVFEIIKAIHQMNSDWMPGKDGIPAKLDKGTGPEAIDVFHDIFNHISEQDKMPEKFRSTLIIALNQS